MAALTLVATTSAASCALLCAASPASAAPAAKATLLTAGADPSATTSGAGASAFAGASATTSAAAAADAGLYDLRGRDLLPLLVPPVMYSSLAAILLLPSDALCRPARRLFVRTLGRVLLPARALTWSDFLLADVMTSLSKSTGDAARAACLIAHGARSSGGRRAARGHGGGLGDAAGRRLGGGCRRARARAAGPSPTPRCRRAC